MGIVDYIKHSMVIIIMVIFLVHIWVTVMIIMMIAVEL